MTHQMDLNKAALHVGNAMLIKGALSGVFSVHVAAALLDKIKQMHIDCLPACLLDLLFQNYRLYLVILNPSL